MKDLSTAISLLNSNGIHPVSEVLQGLEERELTALIIHWSPITKQGGINRILSIIGDEFKVEWMPNSAEIRVTLKK